MIGIIMAGGKGSRMNSDQEKLLIKYKKPIILHVFDALDNSKCFEKIIALTSKNSPNTHTLLKHHNISTINTSGNGYVEDLNSVLCSIDNSVLIVSGDLPLLDPQIINDIVSKYNDQNTWTSFLVTEEFLNSLNYSSDFSVIIDGVKYFYTGISLVNAKNVHSLDSTKEYYEILNDKRIACNLNTNQDCKLLGVS